MTDSAIIALAAAISIAVSTIFPALSQGKAAAAAMESIARQPDAAGDVRSSLIISMASAGILFNISGNVSAEKKHIV